jgi:hypothetical protein
MGNDLVEPPKSILAVLDQPLVAVSSAIAVAREAQKQLQQELPFGGYVGHPVEGPGRARFTGRASEIRSLMLPRFADVDRAACALFTELSVRELQHADAVAMVTALFRGLGMKAGDDSKGLLAGCIDMLRSDAIGLTTGLWKPLGATPVVLALAVRKMFQTTKFPPKPCELREVCAAVRHRLALDHAYAQQWLDKMLDADIVLLEFDRVAWQSAWLDPQFHPLLSRALELHWCQGEHAEELAGRELGEDGAPLLRLPQPPRRLAAARKRSEKRTRKPKPDGP